MKTKTIFGVVLLGFCASGYGATGMVGFEKESNAFGIFGFASFDIVGENIGIVLGGNVACCLPDGTCTEVEDNAEGLEYCSNAEGTINSSWTYCPNPEYFVICASAGPCCQANGTCAMLTSEYCDSHDGVWHQSGTCLDYDCNGVCCYAEGCVPMTKEDCQSLGGAYYNQKYHPNGCTLGELQTSPPVCANACDIVWVSGNGFHDCTPLPCIIVFGDIGSSSGYCTYASYYECTQSFVCCCIGQFDCEFRSRCDCSYVGGSISEDSGDCPNPR